MTVARHVYVKQGEDGRDALPRLQDLRCALGLQARGRATTAREGRPQGVGNDTFAAGWTGAG